MLVLCPQWSSFSHFQKWLSMRAIGHQLYHKIRIFYWEHVLPRDAAYFFDFFRIYFNIKFGIYIFFWIIFYKNLINTEKYKDHCGVCDTTEKRKLWEKNRKKNVLTFFRVVLDFCAEVVRKVTITKAADLFFFFILAHFFVAYFVNTNLRASLWCPTVPVD